MTFTNSQFRENLKVGVIADKSQSLQDVVKKYNKENKLLAIVNAGFFSNSEPVSYFKSIFPIEKSHSSNSAMSPRGCYMVNDNRFEVVQSTEENYKKFQSYSGNIYCAGPQILDNSQDVLDKQLCDENFDPKCRSNKSDPLAINSTVPRAATCHTKGGDFKIIVSQSPTQRCGPTLKQLGEMLASEGCLQGLNHDGGGSVKFWYRDGNNEVKSVGKENRAVPVWLAIYEN